MKSFKANKSGDRVSIKSRKNFSEPVSERIVPDQVLSDKCYLDHLARYEFAKRFVGGKKVLEVGCGTGYGTHLISEFALEIVGIDASLKEAVSYSRRNFRAENLSFAVMDGTSLAIACDSFDIVVSFEAIEHMVNYEQFLEEASRVIKKDGIFIISTPNKLISSLPDQQPYSFHFKEFTARELQVLLCRYFNKVELLGQLSDEAINKLNRLLGILVKLDFFKVRRLFSRGIKEVIVSGINKLTGGKALKDLGTKNIKISKDNLDCALNFIAICREPKSIDFS